MVTKKHLGIATLLAASIAGAGYFASRDDSRHVPPRQTNNKIESVREFDTSSPINLPISSSLEQTVISDKKDSTFNPRNRKEVTDLISHIKNYNAPVIKEDLDGIMPPRIREVVLEGLYSVDSKGAMHLNEENILAHMDVFLDASSFRPYELAMVTQLLEDIVCAQEGTERLRDAYNALQITLNEKGEYHTDMNKGEKGYLPANLPFKNSEWLAREMQIALLNALRDSQIMSDENSEDPRSYLRSEEGKTNYPSYVARIIETITALPDKEVGEKDRYQFGKSVNLLVREKEPFGSFENITSSGIKHAEENITEYDRETVKNQLLARDSQGRDYLSWAINHQSFTLHNGNQEAYVRGEKYREKLEMLHSGLDAVRLVGIENFSPEYQETIRKAAACLDERLRQREQILGNDAPSENR